MKAFILRFTLFVFALIVSIAFLFHLRIWSSDLTGFFFKADRFLELIFVLAVSYAFSMILTKLLQAAARKL